MTAGSDQTSPDHVIPNRHAIHPRDDRETLSALFDGQLPGDAARFALKRLDHDVSWRETCGRWQLIGDALRGQATALAPADFAAGVMRALSSDGVSPNVVPVASSHSSAQAVAGPRRRWIGGAALAASVAMAAALVIRPFSQDTNPASDAQMAAVAPAVSTQQTIAARVPASTVPVSTGKTPPSSSEGSLPAAAVAVAAASRQAATRRIGSNSRGTQSVVRRESTPVESLSNTTAVTAATPATTRQPFHPPADEITTRPWPRAVLPDSAASGALTVGFGSSSAPSPSFYPFEPRPPAETQQASEPQR